MLYTHSFTFCIFTSEVTLFNKDSKCVFHMADMAVGSLAPLTFVAFGIPFLYVLDTFFQKLTVQVVLEVCAFLCVNFLR